MHRHRMERQRFRSLVDLLACFVLVCAAARAQLPAYVAGNEVGVTVGSQDGDPTTGVQQLVGAYCDPSYRHDAVSVLPGATVGFITACPQFAHGAYLPLCSVQLVLNDPAKSPSWSPPVGTGPISWAVPGWNVLYLDPSMLLAWGAPDLLCSPASSQLPAWGPGDLLQVAITMPTSVDLAGAHVRAQWMVSDSSGIYLSDAWGVGIW